MESIDSAQDSYDGTLQTLPVIDQTGTTAPAPLTPKDLNADHVQIRDFSLDKSNDSGLKESLDESHDTTTSSGYVKRLNLAPSTPIKEIEPINSAEAEYMRKEAVSAENLAAIEIVLQGTPRPRRSVAGKMTSYAPNCSPGGTEKKSKQNSRKTKQRDDESQASTSSNVKKHTKDTSQERSVDISSDEENVSSRKVTNKRRKLTDTSDQNEALVVIDPQAQNGAVVQETGRKAMKASKASNSKTSKRSAKNSKKDRLDNDSQSQPNSAKEISSDEEAPVSCGAKPSPKQEDKTKLDVLSSNGDSDSNDHKEKELSQMGTKKSKIASKQSTQKPKPEEELKSSISQVEKKKNSRLSGSFHGKSLGSLLSSFSYGRARHPGLGRKISVPTLHRNRQEVLNPRKPRVILLKKEKKKKDENNEFSDDEMDANNFKQRPNESYEQYLLRVCDEEGAYKNPPRSDIRQSEGDGDDWKDDGIVSNHEEEYEQ